MKRRVEYGLCDLKNNEMTVFIGTCAEIAEYLDRTIGSVYSMISRGQKFNHRYEAYKIED